MDSKEPIERVHVARWALEQRCAEPIQLVSLYRIVCYFFYNAVLFMPLESYFLPDRQRPKRPNDRQCEVLTGEGDAKTMPGEGSGASKVNLVESFVHECSCRRDMLNPGAIGVRGPLFLDEPSM